ncbi:MAG TPA: chemotaxis protein CheW [Gemmatimonadales bacterium]|nr:chemotaxis protein CheW [Gemmatimonadales bacterium]
MSSSLHVYGKKARDGAAGAAGARVETVPLVTFALGSDLLAADVRQVDRVIKLREVAPVPNTPDWLLGMMPYRDSTVPLLDLRRRLELPDAPALEERRIMIFVAGSGFTAAVVDRVLDVRGVPVSDLEPPPPLVRGLSREYVRAVFRRDERIAIMLDADRLLSATERLQLAAAS